MLRNMSKLTHLVGTMLKQDLMDEYGAVVIPRNRVVTYEDIEKAALHPLVNIPTSEVVNYRKLISEAVGQLDEVFEVARYRDRLPLQDVRKNIVPAIQVVADHPNLNRLLYELQIQDNYTVCHSFAVSILSTLIGQWMKLDEQTILELTVAATLHDIGKMKVPIWILNKPGRLTPEEYAEIQKHTMYGYELISNTPGTTQHQALAALQHHERLDGGGYPFRVNGEKICLFARIIGIADVFHAMSSRRVYHDSLPLYEVLEELYAGMFGKFDANILMLVLEKMMNAFVGTEVELSDGRKAEVVMVHAQNPIRPLVKVGEAFIDLSQDFNIQIQEVTAT